MIIIVSWQKKEEMLSKDSYKWLQQAAPVSKKGTKNKGLYRAEIGGEN